MATLKFMSIIVPISLALLVPGSYFSAQGPRTHDLSVQIPPSTEQNSPIQVSGEVSFHEELFADKVRTQWTLDANLLNLSGKTVLAYEVSIEAVPDHGGGVSHLAKVDHFFRSELPFTPGAQERLNVATPNWQLTPRKPGAAPRQPEATFKILFVQFADGSRFGTSAWGNDLRAIRSQTIEHLQAISEQSRSSGETGLRLGLASALQRQDNSKFASLVLGHIRDTLAREGPDRATAEIEESLSAAEKRKWML